LVGHDRKLRLVRPRDVSPTTTPPPTFVYDTDLAYRIATQTSYPSWGYWVSQGANSSWETWSHADPDQSLDHPFLGTINDWLLEAFEGARFHSARWDHGFDLTGKRVAVIGTGASAVQFVPAIQPSVEAMTVFQRTPAWVVPRHDHEVSERTRRLLRAVALLQRLARARVYLQREWFVIAFRNPALMRFAERAARKHLEVQDKDPELRAKLLPDYRLGCKRILISNDYLRALDQPTSRS
jgi:hypothetical protein